MKTFTELREVTRARAFVTKTYGRRMFLFLQQFGFIGFTIINNGRFLLLNIKKHLGFGSIDNVLSPLTVINNSTSLFKFFNLLPTSSNKLATL